MDHDYFESRSTTPLVTNRQPSPSVQRRRRLPRIIEGPFSSSFSELKRNGAASDSEDDSDDDGEKPVMQAWPPRRRQARKAQGESRKGESALKDVNIKLGRPAPSSSGDNRGSQQPEPSSRTQIPKSASTLAPSTPPSTLVVLAGLKEKRQHYSRPLTQELLAQAIRQTKSGIPSSHVSLRNDHQPGQVPGPGGAPDARSVNNDLDPSLKDPEIERHEENISRTTTKRPRRDPPKSRPVAELTESAIGRRNSSTDRSSNTLENTTSTRSTALEAIPAKRRDLHRDTSRSKEGLRSRHLRSDSGVAGSSRLDTRALASHENRALESHVSGYEPSPDPFIDISEGLRRAKSAKRFKGLSRRQTFGGFAAASAIPRLDLTDIAKLRRRVTRHTPLESRTMSDDKRSRLLFDTTPQFSNADSAQSSPMVLETTDQKLIYGEGLKLFIKLMSQNHGFQEDVTWRLWHSLGNLQSVDSMLKEMRVAAEKVAIKAIETKENQLRQAEVAGGYDTKHDDGGSPQHSSSSSPSWRSSYARSSHHSSTKSSSKLSLVPADGTHEPEYSPPQASRAGQFSRLARQGRIKEAFERESRRASRGGVTPRKEPLLQKLVFPETRKEVPVSAPESSPVPEPSFGDVNKADENNSDEEQVVGPGTVWKKEADDVLCSGDDQKLAELEKQMGKHSIKRRTVELLTSFYTF
jgi:hypothetical protein